MTDDAALLRRYAEQGDEGAFAELVRRHIDFVHAAALRQTYGHSGLAQDVTQMVFTDLARKAAALARHAALAGWLHAATRFAASRAVRGERRRQERERAASLLDETAPGPIADWARLQPEIDAALGELKERERLAILLRFFEGRPFAEVGARLALNESAARSCVDRALDKLRRLLERRGIASTGAALSAALGSQAATSAPAGLAATVTTGALAHATAGGGLLAGATAFFAMSKIKLGIAGAVALAGVATGLVELRANRELRTELRALGHEDRDRLERENRRLTAELGKQSAGHAHLEELAHLRQRLAVLRARPDGMTDADLRPPRNLGRATPEAAIETFGWMMDQGDLDQVADFLTFSDGTPENREAFMANFSPEVRARYRTPERLCATAFFGVGQRSDQERIVAMHIVELKEREPGRVRVELWFRTSAGREIPGGDTYGQRADGWAIAPQRLLQPSVLALVRERIDPATGNFIPPKAAPRP